MKIDINELLVLDNKINAVKHDALLVFMAGKDIDRFAEMRDQNLLTVFKLCKKYGVRYIFVGQHELVGCEDIQARGWPAIWAIAEELGVDRSCGNSDQYQIHDPGKIFFPANSYGYWDVRDNIMISEENLSGLKFPHVMHRR